jgi:hypothetical protein
MNRVDKTSRPTNQISEQSDIEDTSGERKSAQLILRAPLISPPFRGEKPDGTKAVLGQVYARMQSAFDTFQSVQRTLHPRNEVVAEVCRPRPHPLGR